MQRIPRRGWLRQHCYHCYMLHVRGALGAGCGCCIELLYGAGNTIDKGEVKRKLIARIRGERFRSQWEVLG